MKERRTVGGVENGSDREEYVSDFIPALQATGHRAMVRFSTRSCSSQPQLDVGHSTEARADNWCGMHD